MSKDVLELLEGLSSDDPSHWNRLASEIQWRRLQLLLLREILVELREVRKLLEEDDATRDTTE